jgi:2-methylcitrate dehydratase PrpD
VYKNSSKELSMTHPFIVSRRRLLQSAGGLLAAAAVRPGGVGVAGAADVSDVMTTLSTFMGGAAARALPDAVVEKTKFMILDTLAAMISGSELPPGRFAIQFAKANGGSPVCTVAGSSVRCGPMEAALANGILAHSDETDDTHPPSQSHPGCAAVPAALAVGEKFAIDGTRFIRAVALGYDIGTRVTATLGKLQYMFESHRSTHGIAGNFVAAAAAGCAAGLDTRQMRWLLSYAAQQASGLASWQRDVDHIEKAFDFGGMGARNGVTAALLVQAGGTGVDDILSGTDNFFQGFVPKNDPGMIVEALGTRFEVMRTDIKKWTVGAPIQAPLDALDRLITRERFDASQVKQVVVRVATDEAAIVNSREISDINLQHLVAVMLLDKTVSFKAAHDIARMKDPAVLRERAKVQLVPDDELEKLMPQRTAIVEVALTDGRTVRERVGTVRGTAANPMTKAEVIAKARDLIAPVLGAATFQKLSDTVFALETANNVNELRPSIQKM